MGGSLGSMTTALRVDIWVVIPILTELGISVNDIYPQNSNMLIPYSVDVPMERLPIANWLLIGATCIISISILIAEASQDTGITLEEFNEVYNNPTKDNIEAITEKANREAPPMPLGLIRGNWLSTGLVSHVFVHANEGHLIGNMIFLFVFGNAVNAKLGHLPFLVLYLFLGAFAGLGWITLGHGISAVGASGAIMGLVGVFLVLYPRNDVDIFYLSRSFGIGSKSISSFWFILFTLALDFIGVMLDGNGGVAYISHLAGTLAGAVITTALVWTRLVRSTDYEENLLEIFGVIEKEGR